MQDETRIEYLRILEDYDFNIQDYIADGGLSVVSQAVSKCAVALGMADVDIDGQNFIAGRIEKMLLGKVSERTKWLSDISSGCILCDIDGDCVSGTVHFHPKRVTVSLNAGTCRLTWNSEAFPTSSVTYTQEPYEGSPANEHGVECAKHIILFLFANRLQMTKSARHC